MRHSLRLWVVGVLLLTVPPSGRAMEMTVTPVLDGELGELEDPWHNTFPLVAPRTGLTVCFLCDRRPVGVGFGVETTLYGTYQTFLALFETSESGTYRDVMVPVYATFQLRRHEFSHLSLLVGAGPVWRWWQERVTPDSFSTPSAQPYDVSATKVGALVRLGILGDFRLSEDVGFQVGGQITIEPSSVYALGLRLGIPFYVVQEDYVPPSPKHTGPF